MSCRRTGKEQRVKKNEMVVCIRNENDHRVVRRILVGRDRGMCVYAGG